MSKSSSANRRQFWRADWLVAVLLVLILHQVTDIVGTIERRCCDLASTGSARQRSDRIAVIAIDNRSVADIGRWRWPRDVHAHLIDQLAAAAGVGHLNQLSDVDGAVRYEPLLVNYDGKAVPSLALLASASLNRWPN